MRSILFPTEFSRLSRHALRYTLWLAERLKAPVTIMNVYHPTASPQRLFIATGNRHRQILRKLKAFALKSLGKRLKNVRFKVKEGSTLPNLLKASKNPAYDLIVMRRRKHYDWLSHFLGSKTAEVTVKSHSPVLILPPKIGFRSFHNILMVTGKDKKTNRAMKAYIDHFISEPGHRVYYESVFTSNNEHQSNRQEKHSLNFSEEVMSRSYPEVKAALQQYIRRNKIDLLVLNIQPKRWKDRLLGRDYMHRLLLDLDIPVLAFNQTTLQNKGLTLTPHLRILDQKRVA